MNELRTGLTFKPQAIVFDVDGTIYDQRGLRLAMARILVSNCVRNPRSGIRTVRFLTAYRHAHELLRGDMGNPEGLSARQLSIACERTGLSHEEGQLILDTSFHAAPLAQLRRFMRPGLTRFLDAARSRGIRLGVYSDYPAEAKLEALGVRQYFESVLSSSDPQVGRLKPDPAGLALCMSRLGVRPDMCLYVGDRPDVDAGCARQAGVCPVIISQRAPDNYKGLWVRTFDELADMLFS